MRLESPSVWLCRDVAQCKELAVDIAVGELAVDIAVGVSRKSLEAIVLRPELSREK